MKMRHVFSTPDLDTAQATMDAARDAGVLDDDILLVARSDIELEAIPNQRKEADTDLMPAAVRGAGFGAGAGLLAGLIAVAMTPLTLTLTVAAVAILVGALIGAWASALFGAGLQDPIRQKFEQQIEAGNILVLIDGTEELLNAAQPRLVQAGATPLPFDSPKMMS